MTIKLLIGTNAKNLVRKLSYSVDDSQMNFIERWFHEPVVKCFIYVEKGTVVSFAILTRCDYDELNKHNTPSLIDLIYTFPDYRLKGYAYKLLLHMKQSNQMTAFCDKNEAIKLFTKAGFELDKYKTCDIPMFRYP